MKRISILLPFALIATLLSTATYALTAQLPTIQTDPHMVYVRVTVLDRSRSRPVRGMHKEYFKVFENGAPQDIAYFSEEDSPLHMGILLDGSGTQKDEITRAMSGMKSTMRPEDEFFLLESGKAPLHDAILQALDVLDQRGNQGKRALMLVTTKKDPGAYPLQRVRERLKDLDIQFFVTVVQTGSDVSSDSERGVLTELTARTGGSAFFPTSLSLNSDILTRVVRQLRNQYRIGYRTTNRALDGKWRKIKITGEYPAWTTGKLKLIKADVIVKTGYYAPTAPK